MANGNPVILGASDTATKQTGITAFTPPSDAALNVQNFGGGAMAVGSVLGNGLTVASVAGRSVSAESFSGAGIVSTCIDKRDVPGISIGVDGSVPHGLGVQGSLTRGRFPGAGVAGRATTAIGVDGVSLSGFGVRGLTKSNSTVSSGAVLAVGSPGHAVIGIATQPFTTPSVPPAPPLPQGPLFAGLFFGNMQISGDFSVTGHKSAAVKHPDGTHRRMYCVEATESWFEDFGSAQLVKGRSDVALDKDFAAVITPKDYHVYVTAEGDCRGLYVTAKTKSGFQVREMQGGSSTISFSYRIVAYRRDLPTERMAVVQLAEMPKGVAEELPAPKPTPRKIEARLEEELDALKKAGDEEKIKPAKASRSRK